MGSSIDWDLIDKFWPVGGELLKFVPAKPNGECIQCGKCCALIRISFDFEYILERARHWIRYTEGSKDMEALLMYKKSEWEMGKFIIDNWIRVPRDEVIRRKFRRDVNADDFFYQCSLLGMDGKCKAHDRWRPIVCTGYPFYDRKTKRQKAKCRVFEGCGFADRRFRKNPDDKRK